MSTELHGAKCRAYADTVNAAPRTPGAFVRIARSRYGRWLREIARDVGASVSFVSDVEHGRRRLSLGNAVRWARGMGLPDGYFVRMVLQEELQRNGIDMTVELRSASASTPAPARAVMDEAAT